MEKRCIEGVVRRVRGVRAGEHRGSHGQQADQQHGGLRRAAFAPQAWPRAQRQQRGGHEQRADGVAEPPRPPELTVPGPRLRTADAQARDADGRPHHRAEERAEDDQTQRVPQPVKGSAEAGEPAKQRGRRNGFERVADRDQKRDGERLVRRRIGDERPDEHTRPGLPTVQKQRRERKPGRRPHQRDLFGRERHRKAELRRCDVNDGCDGSCNQR